MFHGKEPRVNSTSEGNKAKEKPHHRPCLLAATADRAEKQESSHGKKEEDGGGGKEGGGFVLCSSFFRDPKTQLRRMKGGEGETGSEKKTLKSRTREGERRERRNGQEGGKEGERGLWSSRPTQVRLRLLLASASLVYRAKVEGEDLPLHCDAMLPKRGVCVSAKNSCLPLCI